MNKKLVSCKTCGKEISSDAKSCPECGGKVKKNIFKKPWIWIIVFILIIIIAGSGSESNETTNTNESVQDTITTAVDENSDVMDEELKTTTESTTEKKTTAEETTKKEVTIGQKNALKAAKNYLSFSAFSYEGLIKQLEFEQYSHEDAVYAADNCGADWNEQAAKSAKNYLDISSFSKQGLIDQLEYEGFTYEQAVYGAEANGY